MNFIYSTYGPVKQINLVIETLESVLPSVAYGVDKCNVNDKLRLEEEIFQQCEKIIELNLKAGINDAA